MLLQQAYQTMPDGNELTMNEEFKCSNFIMANLGRKLKRGETNQNKVKPETQADGLVMGSRLGWLLSDKG